MGVSYFILISGFLAAAKYHDSGVSSHKGLFIKRLKKYYPLHAITLICSLVLGFRDSWSLRKAFTLFLNASLLQAYVPYGSVYFSFNAVSWYLSLTMFFALVTPVMLRVLHGIERRKLVIQSVLLLGAFQFLWCALVVILVPQKSQHWLVYVSPFVRSIDFLLGGLIFSFIRSSEFRVSQDKTSCMFVYLIACELAFVLVSRNLTGNFANELFSVGAWTIPNMIVIFCVLSSEGTSSFVSRLFTCRPAQFIGNVSFEFFMIHTLVLNITGRVSGKLKLINSSLITYTFALVFTVLFAWLCNRIMHHENFMHSREK